MKQTIEDSKGMITAFESVSPKYERDKNITKETINNFNNIIRENFDLYEVGGTLYST